MIPYNSTKTIYQATKPAFENITNGNKAAGIGGGALLAFGIQQVALISGLGIGSALSPAAGVATYLAFNHYFSALLSLDGPRKHELRRGFWPKTTALLSPVPPS